MDNSTNEILKYAIDNGIINLFNIQTDIEMYKRQQYLRMHPYSIWEGKDKKWYTYLPDSERPRGKVLKKRTTQKSIEDLIVDFWKSKMEPEKIYTFKDVYFKWREVQDKLVSENSIAKYDTDYCRYFKDTLFENKNISQITEDDIKIFLCEKIKEKKLCKESSRKFFGYVSNTFKTARKYAMISDNPMEFLQARDFYKYCVEKYKPDSEKIISDNDMKKLQAQFQQDHQVKPNYMPTYAVEFASLTGMRVSEISALRWDVIKDEYIIIDKSEKSNKSKNKFYIGPTKNNRIRLFPMTDEIRKLLKSIESVEKQYGYYCEWVFADEKGRIHSKTISSCAKTKCRQVGVAEKGIHAFRKTLNSKLRCMGVPVTVAASMLGHTTDVNERYYTFDTTSMDERAEMIERVNKATKN